MNFSFWMVGKTNSLEFKDWENDFSKRLNSFINFNVETIDNIKHLKDAEIIKLEESKKILSKLKKEDHLILLDEKGKSYTSRAFAESIQKLLNISGSKRIIFLVGGAFGFHSSVYDRADGKIALSEMTFSHQLIRLIFMEQLYRAFAIINNHPYHNE
ncbi:MAG: 23S rRNA (pseudouridine(1915)-N(3))-methyltransferase RlmH [Saprospiraceae bacterium]|jgi:23S rRNA (pseudouridine1915-N3)-methyltransferase|uniref:23S rRNA (pseudouridine(1915)-N(3))-methyltransferase RlmH n=1 Tax=Candidatus Brachybacter algidus TaxID=2982024 RepID=UPI001B507623|nr:23S rRNA (pseudouridine(1915)-N(3))-methyltransferase RlmH [Candidatus Brachybacter algidus]MBP7306060.1 23S rRNA (pseudouridine(1915)-N(3))-methyltransferase RlmH [Saprospiraceae bacterium]MBK6372824.1 23S rRNA (pseudouridine(1915)-N(3))-methyltransferase RlmH [Candidatus Brachybacter algidus]MBK6448207.1 23S rRNA (pseudouridine(1915)-N(3))-methyltransferase RlmH [Candidatus Brachybacter algidus]MBK7603021.1 23S rRNA (pseudouridine(1915)-N(3))-methyltransferase RlmH [Candidatus Brachybacter